MRRRFRFFAFGECIYSSSKENICPWRYANKRYDSATGFLFFGRRDYDPELCRWISLDPAGLADGFNRYAYLHNNPLNHSDLYGLKSISEQWKDFKIWAKNLFKSLGSFLVNIFKSFYTVGLVDNVLDKTVGRGMLLFMGHIKTKPQQGFYGRGEVQDKVRVSFMNGVLADYSDLMKSVQALSESHGNVNVHYIYRPTQGWMGDIMLTTCIKLGLVSKEAHSLAHKWKSLIEEMGGISGGGKIIHYAHSMGTQESLHALKLLSDEERQLIHIYSFGSPNLSTDHPHTYHYISSRDGVALLDINNFIQACSGKSPNVRLVGSPLGFPLIDHLFFSETYQTLWRSMGRSFTEWYGAIP